MNDLRDQTQPVGATQSSTAIFMQHVYIWMTAGLGTTALVAYFASKSPALLQLVYGSPLSMLVMFIALFGLVIFLTSSMSRLSAGAATGFFLLYAALMGIFLGPVISVYSSAVISQTFVVTAGMFGGMSVFGMLTRRDLTGMGSFMMMGLWGIILASIVNIFWRNSGLDFGICVIGVIVFVGLTAYDTQKLKVMGESAPLDDSLAIRRGAILGALTLYLDFVNIFLMLLRLFGRGGE